MSLGATFVLVCCSLLCVLLLSLCATLVFVCYSCLCVPLLSWCATLVFPSYFCLCVLLLSLCTSLLFVCYFCICALLLSLRATETFLQLKQPTKSELRVGGYGTYIYDTSKNHWLTPHAAEPQFSFGGLFQLKKGFCSSQRQEEDTNAQVAHKDQRSAQRQKWHTNT